MFINKIPCSYIHLLPPNWQNTQSFLTDIEGQPAESTTMSQGKLLGKHHQRVLFHFCRIILYMKADKCESHANKIWFLDYIIRTWPRPYTVKTLQRFVGFGHFYWCCIRGFRTITAPIVLLKKAHKKMAWNSIEEESFYRLKHSFTSAPVLKNPDPTKPFVVAVDASEISVGVVWVLQRTTMKSENTSCCPFNLYWKNGSTGSGGQCIYSTSIWILKK